MCSKGKINKRSGQGQLQEKKTLVARPLVIICSNHVLWRHGGTHHGTGHVQGARHGQVEVVVVRIFGRLFFDGTKLVIIILQLLFAEAGHGVTFLSGLVRATMLSEVVGARECFVAQGAHVGSFLGMRTHVSFEML